MTTLNNRKAVVTGGSRGLGAAITKKFLSAGAQVVVVGQSAENFKKFAESCGDLSNKLEFIAADLSAEREIESLCHQISKMNVDILVNNAGINKIALAHEVEMSDWNRIQTVNIKAPMMLTKAVLPNMMSRNWGRIVNISSIFGEITKSKRVSYTASKSALIGMTKTVAVDYAEKNILVNCVSPGFLDTELTRSILTEAEIKNLAEQVPMKRLGRPEEIADQVLFLSSPQNTYMTGQNLTIDGGFSIV